VAGPEILHAGAKVLYRPSVYWFQHRALRGLTRKLSYRKDDRAMSALKIFESPWVYAHSYFCRNFQWAFVSIDPVNVPTKFTVRSFTPSWDKRSTVLKNLGSSWIRPRSLFSKICNGWTPWMYWPNLKLAALPIPEIIGGTQKIGQSLDTPTLKWFYTVSQKKTRKLWNSVAQNCKDRFW